MSFVRKDLQLLPTCRSTGPCTPADYHTLVLAVGKSLGFGQVWRNTVSSVLEKRLKIKIWKEKNQIRRTIQHNCFDSNCFWLWYKHVAYCHYTWGKFQCVNTFRWYEHYYSAPFPPTTQAVNMPFSWYHIPLKECHPPALSQSLLWDVYHRAEMYYPPWHPGDCSRWFAIISGLNVLNSIYLHLAFERMSGPKEIYQPISWRPPLRRRWAINY